MFHCDAVTLTFDLEHLHYTGCEVVKLCTKFERNHRRSYCDFNI